jgi:hypothetical protein
LEDKTTTQRRHTLCNLQASRVSPRHPQPRR